MSQVSLRFVATGLLLGATIAASALSERRVPDYLAQPLDTISRQIGGWVSAPQYDQELTPGILEQLKPTSYISRMYRKADMDMNLFISFYAQQRAGENMHSPKHCLPGSGWEIWKHDSALVPTRDGLVKVNQYSIRNSGDKLIVLYWYQSKDRIIWSELKGKMLLAKDALIDGRTAASLMRLTLPDTPQAPAEGVEFAKILIPQLQSCFGAKN